MEMNTKVICSQKLVEKTDGTVPTVGAISMAARDFKDHKEQTGRKKGWKATTKAEDKKIMQVFSKLRPPGAEGIEKERSERDKKRERERDRERVGERKRGGEGERESSRRTDTATEREGGREMHPEGLREMEGRKKTEGTQKKRRTTTATR